MHIFNLLLDHTLFDRIVYIPPLPIAEGLEHSVLACSLSHVWLLVTYQAPLSMGFPRQESWSGLQFLLQGIFLIQGLNPSLLHCRWILYHWATMEALLEHRMFSLITPGLILYLLIIIIIIFWPCPKACRILVLPPGVEPMLPALERQSVNH